MGANVVVPAWWLDGCRHRDVNHSMSCGLSHEPGCVPSCPVATSFAAYAHVELDGTQRTVLRLLAERDALSAQLAEAHRTATRLREVNEAARQELTIVIGERDAKGAELALLRVAHEALEQGLRKAVAQRDSARKDHGRTGDALHAVRRELESVRESFNRVFDDRSVICEATKDALGAGASEHVTDAAKRVAGERDELARAQQCHRELRGQVDAFHDAIADAVGEDHYAIPADLVAAVKRLAAHRCPRRGKRAREVIRTAIVQGRHILDGTFRYADCTTHEAACVAIAKSVDARKARGR